MKRFTAARRDGFRAVEIQFPYDYPIADLKRQLSDNDLECVLINVSAGDLLKGGEGLACVPGKTAEYAAAVVECLSYARALKIPTVNVLPGRCRHPERRDEYMATFLRNMQVTADSFAPFGITTTFEAINRFDMPDFLVCTGREMLAIMVELKHPNIKAQFDIYHMSRMGVDVAGFIRRHGHKIGHIQFADMPGRQEPGTGRVKFDEVFAAIENSHYDGWVGAEYRPSRATSTTLDWMARFEALRLPG
ncbi:MULTISPECIES: hydroxypyruvate isomerase family protein [unclassified Oceanobacter]|jgi:hydroxypyruvate isomerase|uniref:hydroxypyruvate isomerase family protein n=1 Tax=unclassified Oceanobacter TaxID=2620260 RepID=UPI0026E144A6|nr:MULTISPECIES: TIM barrel protein [unclassified Oceanobacter]MDO6682710.1 TIM barrel protein [Oceanobacter sp. 5_MG-2023]MDP2507189.1 TIM barrel protein [Oceanobacter sp. 3_MG-2023]MDP2549142.1 TIM barrel protein [Oceanobacter sp. 4_MG-2023]MDP2609051.1 TIM barrel protein [Oceanobacter sp. 1_MG-2023]MDP2612373.1 TIM barrel protein [Oceanobacter sp. 2_MG-2023]